MALRDDCVGIVLAGGQSRRMGQPKQSLIWPDYPRSTDWQTHAVNRLQSVCTTVLVSGSEQLPDLISGQPGPLAGIAAALDRFAEQSCVFLPVDMPLVSETELQALLSVTTPHAAFQNSLFPLCLQADQSTREQATTGLGNSDPKQRSVRGLLQSLGNTLTWLQGSAERLQNINTPDELERVLRLAHSMSHHELKENPS